MQKIWFIINPVAGTGRKTTLQEDILGFLDTFFYEPHFYFTEKKASASWFVRRRVKKGDKIFVAVGGDGTVNEVASELVNTNCILGIIPTGSGNGLSRHLKIPFSIKKSVEVINKAFTRSIDYGKLNKRFFFCTCGVGFDAHVGHLFAEADTRGFISYIRAALMEFRRYKPKKYKLIDRKGNKRSCRAFLVTFANASQYGNNAFIAPDADVFDGFLDVCIMRPFPLFRAIPLSFRLFSKTIHRSDLLETIRVKELTLLRKKRGEVHFDGEPCMMGKRIKVKIVPAGLRIYLPEGKS